MPVTDPSGVRLRQWMSVDETTFYDSSKIALLPMGFCYPGRGRGGDLPPRPECAATWRDALLSHLTKVELTIAIGRYAIDWHLKPAKQSTLTEIVGQWRDHWPNLIPLPHPSPRNTQWLKKSLGRSRSHSSAPATNFGTALAPTAYPTYAEVTT